MRIIKLRSIYQCSKKLVTYKEYCCFDHSDFPAHSMFTFDVCWGSLGTSIFGNSSSASSNTRSRLPSRLSFRFLWLWSDLLRGYCMETFISKYFIQNHWRNKDLNWVARTLRNPYHKPWFCLQKVLFKLCFLFLRCKKKNLAAADIY